MAGRRTQRVPRGVDSARAARRGPAGRRGGANGGGPRLALRGVRCRSGARSPPHPARWRGDAGVRQSRWNRVRDRRFFRGVGMRGSDQPVALLELVPRLLLAGLRLPGLLRPSRLALQRRRFILRTDRRPAHATLIASSANGTAISGVSLRSMPGPHHAAKFLHHQAGLQASPGSQALCPFASGGDRMRPCVCCSTGSRGPSPVRTSTASARRRRRC